MINVLTENTAALQNKKYCYCPYLILEQLPAAATETNYLSVSVELPALELSLGTSCFIAHTKRVILITRNKRTRRVITFSI